jgi:hypothetical protein
VTYTVCQRCQKGYLFPTELHSYGQVSISKPGISAINSPIRARTCGACGYTEIYAQDGAKLRPVDYPATPPGKEPK